MAKYKVRYLDFTNHCEGVETFEGSPLGLMQIFEQKNRLVIDYEEIPTL